VLLTDIDPRDLLTADEAAALRGVRPTTVRQWVHHDRLAHVDLGDGDKGCKRKGREGHQGPRSPVEIPDRRLTGGDAAPRLLRHDHALVRHHVVARTLQVRRFTHVVRPARLRGTELEQNLTFLRGGNPDRLVVLCRVVL
jgi:hypothetical protein